MMDWPLYLKQLIDARCFQQCSELKTLNFSGTKAQWAEVAKGTDWNDGISTDVVHCFDGDVTLYFRPSP